MKVIKTITCLAVIAFPLSARSQYAFQNLDFEAANVSQTQVFNFVQTSDALPGWAVQPAIYGTNGTSTYVLYDGLIAGAPQVDLLGTNRNDITRIEGNFGVFLQGGYDVAYPAGIVSTIDVTLSQSGLVPATAQSILFKAVSGTQTLSLSLDGQNIPFAALAVEPGYTLYGGDISAFAGQTLELTFTAGFYGTGWNLDSIEFSSQSIPEPSAMLLLIAGSTLFPLRLRSTKSQAYSLKNSADKSIFFKMPLVSKNPNVAVIVLAIVLIVGVFSARADERMSALQTALAGVVATEFG